METKEPGDFYHSLPRKELQDLCKKYGLSPYKSSSNLVNSLDSYFENWSSIAPVKRSSVHTTSLIPQLQCRAQSSSVADSRKDSCGNATYPREEDRKIDSQTVKSNELQSSVQISEDFGCSIYNIRRSARLTNKKRETSCLQNVFKDDVAVLKSREKSPKISFDRNNLSFAKEVEVRNIPQVHHQAENAVASSMEPSTSVPSFEFYVRSEEGIILSVDLNSSPSDCFKRLENEVCSSQNLQNNFFQSFRQELECLGNCKKQMKSSLLWNRNSDIGLNNGYVQIDSSPNSIKRENDRVGFDQPDGGDGSLGFSAIKPFSIATDMSAHSEEEKEVHLLFDAPNQMVSHSESCPRIEETRTFDSNVLDAPQVKLTCNSVVSLTSNGTESLNRLEDQKSKLGNENYWNIALQNTCSHENLRAVYSGCSAIGSMEIQSSEVACQQKDSTFAPENYFSLNLVDRMHNMEKRDGGLVNFSEVNHNSCGKHTPTSAEEWKIVTSSCCVQQCGSPVTGTEASDPLEKTLEDSVSDGIHKRNRHDSEINNFCGQHDGRILRSAKRLGGKVLPRRSMRLLTK